MSCSMITIVSVPFSSATRSVRRAVPSAPRPDVGSSRNRILGSVARARPISSALRSPYARSPVRTRSRPRNPTRPRIAAAWSCAAESRARSRHTSNDRLRIAGSATSTLSSAVSSSKRLMPWNDRATPLRVISAAPRPAIARPSRRMSPRSGAYRPVRQLKQVVLPAPFGPMMPVSEPASKARSMRSSTTRSPNRLCRPTASNSATQRALRQRAPRSANRPARPSGFHSTTAMNSSPYQNSHVSV